MDVLIILLFAYFFGGIPFGLLAAKMQGIDITKTGSGNIGATNVFRTLGKWQGLTVLALDMFKGYLPVALAGSYINNPALVILTAGCAIAGHMFSPFLNFKGGKGVATGLGVIAAIAPRLFLLSFALGLGIIGITGYVSLASVTGSLMLCILMFTSGQPIEYAIGILVLTSFIIYKHLPNISRLLKGTENKIKWK